MRPGGRGGKVAKSDAHNLCERLRKHEAAVLLFAKEPLVPFTNNRAERDLRMGKVKQKVSGCFRTERYAKAYCRISSYLQSMAYQGINPLVAIQMALSAAALRRKVGAVTFGEKQPLAHRSASAQAMVKKTSFYRLQALSRPPLSAYTVRSTPTPPRGNSP